MSIIQKPFVRSQGAAIPDAPNGAPFVMLDRAGKVYNAGIQKLVNKHPGINPMASGLPIHLGTNGPFSEDPADGYIKTTGTSAQTADGLVSTLNAGNILTEIDLPGIGPFTPGMIHVEMGISGASPVVDNAAGFRIDNNLIAFNYNIMCIANATEWRVGDRFNGIGTGSYTLGTLGLIAFSNEANLGYIELGFVNNWSITTGQNYSASMGTTGIINKLDGRGGGFSSTGYPNLNPPTFDLILRAQWLGGSDLVVTWKSVTILPKLQQTSVG